MLFAKDRFCGLALGYCGVMTTGATTCTAVSGPVISKCNFIINKQSDSFELLIAKIIQALRRIQEVQIL
jgi:hypothetical protein